ncbi:hypothetical protein H109_00292 [Trichophyton interdigitale MR816]|uniref:Piwi domain-containing protein n=1 Tax=Trichophyton interdigitale (strain MR816) TaxID=1215338 RepID=A0A059JJ69_TRIIM|nr:hypothetical protein H101_06379 [Trichophyton interdigitale H6]KDB27920.1 hypothetical protein H109_00292 [Trichophyton interdigitale MR816]
MNSGDWRRRLSADDGGSRNDRPFPRGGHGHRGRSGSHGRGEYRGRGRSFPARGGHSSGGTSFSPSGSRAPEIYDGGPHILSEKVKSLEDNVVAKRDSGLETKLMNLSLRDSPSKPIVRPGYNNANERKVKLWANYFEIQGLENVILYQYYALLDPGVELGRHRTRRLLSLLVNHRSLTSHSVATNYKDRIISNKELNVKQVVVQYYEKEEQLSLNSPSYRVTIQLQRVFRMGEVLNDLKSSIETYNPDERNEAIQALNVVLAHSPNESPNTQFLGQSKHFPLHGQQNKHEMGAGLDAIRGFFHSVRPSTGRLLLNLNVSTGAFYHAGTLHTLVCRFDQGRRLSGSIRLRELNKFLHKLRVVLSCPNNAISQATGMKTIQSIVKRNNLPGTIDNIRFEWPSGGMEREVSVREFYRQVYSIDLIEKDQIVVDVGTKGKPIYLPAELCHLVPGQPARQRLSARQTSDMIKVACCRPGANANSIVRRGLPLMGVMGDTGNIKSPKDFGVEVARNMLAVTGSILSPPQLLYKYPVTVNRPDSWNLSKNIAFNKPGTFGPNNRVGCLVIMPYRGQDALETTQFMTELGKHMKNYGINWPTDRVSRDTIRLSQDEQDLENSLDEYFLRVKKLKQEFTLIVLPRYDAEIYSKVKYSADVTHGCHTLCVVPKPPKNGRSGEPLQINIQPSYLANLALKINLKLGGVNHQLEPLKKYQSSPIMYLGIDVTHPTGTDSVPNAPSIAGVVANCDPMLGQWPASIRTQAHCVEMVENLGEMVTERLQSWKNQGHLPEKIIVYRDGVSESQYKQVLDFELPQINDAVCHYYRNGKHPKVTLIIVGKRHHTRQACIYTPILQQFYPVLNEPLDDKTENVLPGTVVDRGCTTAREFDFFMVAHAGIQGTSRPAHYVVLKDGNNFTANELQSMTHNLSYVFGRATRSVSIATPAYYADILCERGRCYLYDTFHRKDHYAGTPYNVSQSKWLWGVHTDLADSMFYI